MNEHKLQHDRRAEFAGMKSKVKSSRMASIYEGPAESPGQRKKTLDRESLFSQFQLDEEPSRVATIDGTGMIRTREMHPIDRRDVHPIDRDRLIEEEDLEEVDVEDPPQRSPEIQRKAERLAKQFELQRKAKRLSKQFASQTDFCILESMRDLGLEHKSSTNSMSQYGSSERLSDDYVIGDLRESEPSPPRQTRLVSSSSDGKLQRKAHRVSAKLAMTTDFGFLESKRDLGGGGIVKPHHSGRPGSTKESTTSREYDDYDDEDSLSSTEVKENKKKTWWWPPKFLKLAGDRGGNYSDRFIKAVRVALGSGFTFAILVLPEEMERLGVVWLGHIWYHCNIGTSLGSSLPMVYQFSRSMLIVTLLSWPIAYAMSFLSHWLGLVVLPFVTFFLSLFVMSSPQVTSNSLQIIVMYVIIASPIGARGWIPWAPFGWLGTYMICLGISVLVNILPYPNLAIRKTTKLLERFEKDVTVFFLSAREYSNSNGTNLKRARQAISSIEFMSTRIAKTVASLKAELPASKVELRLMRWKTGGKAGADLEEWILQTERLLQPLQQLRSALTQKVIGEDTNYSSPALAESKIVLNREISPARDRLVDAMVASIVVCHAWADPYEGRTILRNVKLELREALEDCQDAFKIAIFQAAHKAVHDSTKEREKTTLFAHLTRRMSSFHAMFALAESLLRYFEAHEKEKPPKPKFTKRVQNLIDGYKKFWFGQDWKWNNPDGRRMALKTSVGMVLASFFICVPHLKETAAPYGTLSGITVASVNLATTGSSFHKASDRLMATMVAGAFSLIIGDFFMVRDHDIIKILALTLLTFCMIYLQTAEHAYMYTYTSVSAGIMLFSSVKIDYDVVRYVPKRIELVFLGICIFALTELMIFPRSSRKMVETNSLDFCMTMRDFLRQAVMCSLKLEVYVNESKHWNENTRKLLEGSKDPFELDDLKAIHAKMKKQSDTLSKEIESAIAEPSLGMGQPIQAAPFRHLVVQHRNSERHALLLYNTLVRMAKYYQEKSRTLSQASSDWPRVHRVTLQGASETVDSVCDWLQYVFPDGHIRSQGKTSNKAVNAASAFRSLEDVRLKIVADWSRSFEGFVKQNGYEESEPEAVMTLGIMTTTILEICRYMQDAGKSIEEIAYNFPHFE